jgi:S-(hydroxymethyl)glutathione dehydrogenase/alcohol dehydrogenase
MVRAAHGSGTIWSSSFRFGRSGQLLPAAPGPPYKERRRIVMKNAKAAVLHAVREPLVVETLAVRAPQTDEVLVRLGASGVCHSDLHAITGDLPMPLPTVLGHEGAGVVEAVGASVKRVKEGDHVILNWVPYCGGCWYCQSGRMYLCETGYIRAMGAEVFKQNGNTVTQFAGVGSMSEYTVVPENSCIPIDHDIPFDRACLVGCGVMTGVGAVMNTARVQPGESVAVFGAGGVGLNVIQGAGIVGANPIIAVDLNERKLGFAKQFGATHVVNGGKGDPVDAIKELTGGRGVDYAFEVIGRADVMVQAFMATRRGGKAVIVGVPPMTDMVSVPGFLMPLAEKSLIGSLYGSADMSRDVPRLLGLYRAGKLKLDELVTRRFRIEEVGEAFGALERGEVARGVIAF